MTKEEVIQYFNNYQDTTIDCPFPEDFSSVVIRHTLTKKWYALLMTVKGEKVCDNRPLVDVINIKCDEILSQILREKYIGIIPAYHMNKKKWITIILDKDLPSLEIISLIEQSFDLTTK